jgi:3-hydroxyanthranilate 3,4-dioxygenase
VTAAEPLVPATATVDGLLASGRLLGSYDDLPLLPPGANPCPYLSRNRVPQPFFLAAATSAVLAHLRGEADLDLRGPTRTVLRLRPGDHVSLPADVPYRVLPRGECVQVIYRVEPRGREVLLWYCPYCDTRLYPHYVEAGPGPRQPAYWAAVQAFNTTTDLRLCEYCGALHQPVSLADLRWQEAAAPLARPPDREGPAS